MHTPFAGVGLHILHRTGFFDKGPVVENQIISNIYSCTLHPQIRRHRPSHCPICGMTLEPIASDDGPLPSDINKCGRGLDLLFRDGQTSGVACE